MDNVTYLSGGSRVPDYSKKPHSFDVRNKQAVSMLEASLGIEKVIVGMEAGIQYDLSIDDLREISDFLRSSIYN